MDCKYGSDFPSRQSKEGKSWLSEDKATPNIQGNHNFWRCSGLRKLRNISNDFLWRTNTKEPVRTFFGRCLWVGFHSEITWPLRPQRQYPLGFNFLLLGARTWSYSSFILRTAGYWSRVIKITLLQRRQSNYLPKEDKHSG